MIGTGFLKPKESISKLSQKVKIRNTILTVLISRPGRFFESFEGDEDDDIQQMHLASGGEIRQSRSWLVYI